MKFRKLKELVNNMSEEQLEMDVVLHVGGEYFTAVVISEICHADEEVEYPIGQPVIG